MHYVGKSRELWREKGRALTRRGVGDDLREDNAAKGLKHLAQQGVVNLQRGEEKGGRCVLCVVLRKERGIQGLSNMWCSRAPSA